MFNSIKIVEYYDGIVLGIVGSTDGWFILKLLSSVWLNQRYYLMIDCPSSLKETIDNQNQPFEIGSPKEQVYEEIVSAIESEIDRQLKDSHSKIYILLASSDVNEIRLVVQVNNHLIKKSMAGSPDPLAAENSFSYWQHQVEDQAKLAPEEIGWK